MDRIPTPTALTSTETASLLDVHPSTVKRWCNDGELDSELTPGGHRRISVDAAMAFARDRGIGTVLTPFHPFEPHVWTALRALLSHGSFRELVALALQWARRGEFERLERLYLALGRTPELRFCDFVDHAVRDLLTAVGHEWAQGKLRVGDEHMVTQAVAGALYALRREWADSPSPSGFEGSGRPDARPVAIVGTLEGNQHALGALCIRMLLEREGWRVFYPGADVPIEDFAMIQRSREASLVCISLPPNGSLGDVTRALSVLRRHYDRARPCAVAFGGGGGIALQGEVVEEPFESVSFHASCASLRDALVENGRGPVLAGEVA